MRLARPVIFNDVMKSARIPASVFPIADGAELSVIGWGALSVSMVIFLAFSNVRI